MKRLRIEDAIVTAGAVDLSVEPRFPVRSGRLSTVYCDLRRLLAHPREREIVADALVEEIADAPAGFDTLAATASGAIAWGAFAAAHPSLQKPLVYVTAEPKKHGSQSRIHGHLPDDHRVALVEDVVNRGGSAARAVETLRDEGAARVHDVFAIVRYPVSPELDRLDPRVQLHTLVGIEALVRLAADRQELSRRQLQAVLAGLDA